MKPEDIIIVLFGIVISLWPALVSSAYLVWKFRIIQQKLSFWFGSVLLGYFLMFGVPLFLRFLLLRFLSANTIIESKGFKDFAPYYWLAFAIIALIFILAPVIATYVLYKKKYSVTKSAANQSIKRDA